jgi:tetratricopeptide (TPR) repeat protein
MRLAIALAAALLIAGSPAVAQPSAAPATVGTVSFPNSGKSEAQAPFLRGLALLHNFEYSRAAEAFVEAQKADPDFAMAFWGEAMTHNHPIWMEQDKKAAEAVLARLGPDRLARLARARTPRERAYLEAVEILYGPGSKEERDKLYSNHMAALATANPEDVDARAFHALSILGLAHDGRDHSLYMRAAAVLEEVYPGNAEHPGVVHYLIHSYDDPVHAPLGLRTARTYGRIAPDAGHALHMTSHIFLALGMWEEVQTANEQAMKVVNAQARAAGRSERYCGHYPDWLVYARMQRGIDVTQDLAACRADAARELASAAAASPIEPVRSDVVGWTEMALRHGIETGQWDNAGPEIPEGRYGISRFIRAYGQLLAAGSDPDKVGAARTRLEAIATALAPEFAKAGAAAVDAPRWQRVVLMQAGALDRLAAGDNEAGIAGLRAAAEAEAALPIGYGPPMIEKPSYELLGDALARLGKHTEAAQAYRAALRAAPNRRLSMRGLEVALSNGVEGTTSASAATTPAHAGH